MRRLWIERRRKRKETQANGWIIVKELSALTPYCHYTCGFHQDILEPKVLRNGSADRTKRLKAQQSLGEIIIIIRLRRKDREREQQLLHIHTSANEFLRIIKSRWFRLRWTCKSIGKLSNYSDGHLLVLTRRRLSIHESLSCGLQFSMKLFSRVTKCERAGRRLPKQIALKTSQLHQKEISNGLANCNNIFLTNSHWNFFESERNVDHA